MRLRLISISLLVLALVLSACSGDDKASRTPTKGAELLTVLFDEAGTWEESRFPADAADPDSVLAISEGRYQIDHQAGRSSSFAWGTGGDDYQNVIIEVDAEQLSPEDDNLYGVLCRLTMDERGRWSGYALLISGDGHYGIAEFSNNSLNFLLAWHQSDAINQGSAKNTLRAVCVDDKLMIYANDKFLGEVKDDQYSAAGQVGLIAGITKEHAVSIAFDNLVVFEGSLSQ
jgi:hypothetical protein